MGLKLLIFAVLLIFADLIDGLAPELPGTQELVLQVKRFQPCNDVVDPILKYETLGVDHVAKDTYKMFGNIVSEEPLDGKLKFLIELDKCGDEGISDTCERRMTYKIEDFCADIKMPSSMARGFLEDSGIPPECPIPPGNYQIKPNEIKLEGPLKEIISTGKYWRLKAKIIRADDPNGKMEFCFTCEGKAFRKDSSSTRQRKPKGK